jgi:hypothetical protein
VNTKLYSTAFIKKDLPIGRGRFCEEHARSIEDTFMILPPYQRVETDI